MVRWKMSNKRMVQSNKEQRKEDEEEEEDKDFKLFHGSIIKRGTII